MAEALEELRGLEGHLAASERRIEQVCAAEEPCRRLDLLPGVGALTATALVAAVGDAKHYRGGRQMSCALGLPAREHSSGGHKRQLGMSKRGNLYVRTLLIHGARSVLRHAARKTDPDPLIAWALAVQARRGTNIATVALANKLARIAWAMLARDRHYDPRWKPPGRPAGHPAPAPAPNPPMTE